MGVVVMGCAARRGGLPEQPLVSADCPTSPNGLTPRGSRSHARICQSRRAQRGVLIRGFLFHTLLLATSLPFAGTPPAQARAQPPDTANRRLPRRDRTPSHSRGQSGPRHHPAGHRFLHRTRSRTDGGQHVRLPAQSAAGEWRVGDTLQDPFIFGYAVLGADWVAAAVRSPLDADSERFYPFREKATPIRSGPSSIPRVVSWASWKLPRASPTSTKSAKTTSSDARPTTSAWSTCKCGR